MVEVTHGDLIAIVETMDKMVDLTQANQKRIIALEGRVADLELHLLHFLRSRKYNTPGGQREILDSIVEV